MTATALVYGQAVENCQKLSRDAPNEYDLLRALRDVIIDSATAATCRPEEGLAIVGALTGTRNAPLTERQRRAAIERKPDSANGCGKHWQQQHAQEFQERMIYALYTALIQGEEEAAAA